MVKNSISVSSPRRLIAVKKISEIIGKTKKQKNVTVGRILRESGYSVSTSKTPSRIIKGKKFQELLKDHLPDDLIAKTHEGLLRASRLDHYVFPSGEDDRVIKKTIESVAGCKLIRIRKHLNWKRAYFWTPDNQSRMKAIAEAYKLKGKYPAERHKHEVQGKLVIKETTYDGNL